MPGAVVSIGLDCERVELGILEALPGERQASLSWPTFGRKSIKMVRGPGMRRGLSDGKGSAGSPP